MVHDETSDTIGFRKTFTKMVNLALAAWIFLDTVAFMIYNLIVGVVFLLVALIAVYGVLKFLGCLRPCYNCTNAPSAWDVLQRFTLANVVLKTINAPTI